MNGAGRIISRFQIIDVLHNYWRNNGMGNSEIIWKQGDVVGFELEHLLPAFLEKIAGGI